MSLNSDPDSILVKIERVIVNTEAENTRVVTDYLRWVQPEQEFAPGTIEDGPEF